MLVVQLRPSAGCLNAKGSIAFGNGVFAGSGERESEEEMPTCARTHCARVCSRFPALEGIVGGRNGAAKRHSGNLARNYYATSSMPRSTATETEVPEKEIAKKNHSAHAHVDITKRVDMLRCAKDRGNSGSLEFQHISHSSVKIASRA